MDHIENVRAQRQVASLGQSRLASYDVGEGPVTLFVHGVFMNGLLWSKVIPPLAAAGRRCIAVDLPAHGESLADPEQDLSLTALADLLAALLDELGVDAVDLVGNDTGGALAQILAVRHADRVRTLTLTNCDAHDNLPPEAFKFGQTMAENGELAPLIQSLAGDLDAARGEGGLGMGFADTAALTDEEVRALGLAVFAEPARAQQLERFVASTRVEDLLAVEAELGRLETPTLVVWGTEDLFFEVDWAYWLRDNIPGAGDVVEVPGGKLFFCYERADELLAPLSRFLDQHSPAAAASSVDGER